MSQKNQQRFTWTGAGTLSGVHKKQSENEKSTPYELTWQQDLDFNSAANTGNVNGERA